MGLWLPDTSIWLAKADAVDGPDPRPHRPWSQGDIFHNVPITGTKRLKDGQEAERAEKTKICHAMLLGHPCSIRGGLNHAINQTVAPVIPMAAEGFVAPWDDRYYAVPLPDFVDGNPWIVDLRMVTFTHYKNLEGKRIASLSLDGLVALQRRYINHAARIYVEDDRPRDTVAVYNEITIWEAWNAKGHDQSELVAWLNEPLDDPDNNHPAWAGQARRQLLEYGPDALLAELPES